MSRPSKRRHVEESSEDTSQHVHTEAATTTVTPSLPPTQTDPEAAGLQWQLKMRLVFDRAQMIILVATTPGHPMAGLLPLQTQSTAPTSNVVAVPGPSMTTTSPWPPAVIPVLDTADTLSWHHMIMTMPEDLVRQLLVLATEQSADLQTAVTATYDAHQTKLNQAKADQARLRVVHFTHYNDDVDHILDVKHSSNTGSEECEIAVDAVEDLEALIEEIRDEGSSDLTFSSKWDALVTLVSIGGNIIDAPWKTMTTLRLEVRKGFQESDLISKAMRKIIKSMSSDHRLQLVQAGESTDPPGEALDVSLEDQVKLLDMVADGNAMRWALYKVLQLLED